MKLRNKKTGEIPDKIETITYIQWSKSIMMAYINNDGERILKQYDSLETFKEEWEDYKEPKEYWYMDYGGRIKPMNDTNDEEDMARKQIGNYFETKEEAEKAVKKLKAWKRLKDKGFKFTAWKNGILLDETVAGQVRYEFPIDNKDDIEKDLYLLFGGEE